MEARFDRGEIAAERGGCFQNGYRMAPDRPRFFGGLGRMPGVAEAYHDERARLFAELSSEPSWLGWWAGAKLEQISIITWFRGGPPKTKVASARGELVGYVSREISSVPAAVDEAAALAHRDVLSVLEAVRKKTGLPQHPNFGRPADGRPD